MKFTCLRSELASAVSNVSRAVSAKASIPALEGILIKAYDSKLVLSGYDLEIGITTTMDATVNEEGEIVVSAKLFSDIVRKLPETSVSSLISQAVRLIIRLLVFHQTSILSFRALSRLIILLSTLKFSKI